MTSSLAPMRMRKSTHSRADDWGNGSVLGYSTPTFPQESLIVRFEPLRTNYKSDLTPQESLK